MYMTGRALSERAKKQQASNANEQRMQSAILDKQLENEHGVSKSLRRVAFAHSISKSTLQRRTKGGQSIQEFNVSKQKLTCAEEQVLVDFILESANRGFPLDHKAIRHHANAIRESRLGEDCEKCKRAWVTRFLNRHRDTLQTHWSKSLDTQRAKCLNPEAVESWFKIVKTFITDKGVLPTHLYAMDESGFPPALQGTCRVVGARGTKIQHQQGGANRENVTALVCICADGTSLKPMIIFKGKNFMEKWNNNNLANAL